MKTVKTGAKVNLSLAVTGRREGLHTLDMRVCTVSLFDGAELLSGEGERFVFRSVPDGFEKERFLPRLEDVYAKLRAAFGGSPRFALEKGIPSGAGLGGSSALAVCMTRLWAAESGAVPSEDLLLSLGSDVPYMYRGGDARVTGVGERVQALPFCGREVLILFPEGEVDTAKAYAEYDRMRAAGELPERAGEFFNDLFAPAVRLNAKVGEVYDILRAAGARNVVMTGSGSAVCAFPESGEECARLFAATEGLRRVRVRTLPAYDGN